MPRGRPKRVASRTYAWKVITARTRAARAERDAFIADAPPDPELDALPVMVGVTVKPKRKRHANAKAPGRASRSRDRA